MRIEQVACFLNNVVKDVLNGHLVPADFQRPYVWTKADVLALCESIGSLLIWQPHGKADLGAYARVRLGPIARQETGRPVGLLLDGQNRLATFAWMTQQLQALPNDLSEAERATWGDGESLVVDLGTRTMRFASREEADQGFTMPAHCLLDQTWLKLIRKRYTSPGWSRFSEAERDDGVGWWDFVAGRFRDARIVATYLEDATVDEARKAFLHICRVGVPMSSNDFDRALGWAASK